MLAHQRPLFGYQDYNDGRQTPWQIIGLRGLTCIFVTIETKEEGTEKGNLNRVFHYKENQSSILLCHIQSGILSFILC